MADRQPDEGRGVKRPIEDLSAERREDQAIQEPQPAAVQQQQQPQQQPRQPPQTTVPLRTGQWTQEEIAFAKKVIEFFDRGSLPNCANGTTLRALLADILHCSPMRISKKFAGDIAIGKRTFTKHNIIDRQQMEDLERLERDFHESIQGRARWPNVRLVLCRW